MATWFRLPKALVGVSNKAGSSTMRKIASGKFKEYDPRSARAHALRECIPSFLVLRDPVARAESAYNYFAGLGWPRLTPTRFESIEAFHRHLMTFPPGQMDPHWKPQKLQHEVVGQQWWDHEIPFELATEVIFGGIHENATQGGHTERFTSDERWALLDTVYLADLALPPKRLDYLQKQLIY